MSNKKKHKGRIIALTSVLSVIVLIAGAFFIYTGIYYHADEEVEAYLKSDDDVLVRKEDNMYVFQSKSIPENAPTSAFVFYPGAKVEYTAYAPVMYRIAKESPATVYLVHMPFNLAMMNEHAVDKIMDSHEDVTHWYLGGHSLGGAVASMEVASHSHSFTGLILEASYSNKDLTGHKDMAVLSLLGSNDGVINRDNYEKYNSNLPKDKYTEYIIDGGIHSYFGDYGHQSKDGTAGITKEEQWSQISHQVSAFIIANSLLS